METETNYPASKFVLLQVITLLRIPLAILLVVIVTSVQSWSFFKVFFCAAIIGLIELTDLLDGYMARRIGIVTEWGAMLDPYADSTSRLISYWGFAVAGLVIPLVPLAMAFRDITVAYCRITLTRFGKTVSAKRSGKIKAIFQGIGAVLIIGGPLHWQYTGRWTIDALSWMIILVTLGSIVEYAVGAINAALEKKDITN